LTIDSFSSFYRAIHGYPPFLWQQELLKRVVAEGWPATIAMPTSSGKTSAIDVAVFHLALEAGKSAFERRSSLRTFFIVDRRVVVDEAFDHAAKIANRLHESNNGVVKEVADRLNIFGGEVPLQVSKMRGGMLRDIAVRFLRHAKERERDVVRERVEARLGAIIDRDAMKFLVLRAQAA